MSHLRGRDVTALVDARLDPRARERAAGHLAVCAPCRERVQAERELRRLLAAGRDVAPSERFRRRLLDLPQTSPAAGYASRPGAARFAPGVAPRGSRRTSRDHAGRRSRTRWAGAVALGAAASVGGLFVLGLAVEPGLDARDLAWPAATSAPSTTAVTVVDDTAGRDVDGTARAVAWMRTRGWAAPSVVPAALEVVDLRTSTDGVLVVDLAGPGARVLLLEQRGRLDPAVTATANPLAAVGEDAYLVSSSPWTAVRQAGDVAVAVVTQGHPDAARRLLAAIPDAAPALDPADRIGRGWATLTASLARLGGR